MKLPMKVGNLGYDTAGVGCRGSGTEAKELCDEERLDVEKAKSTMYMTAVAGSETLQHIRACSIVKVSHKTLLDML